MRLLLLKQDELSILESQLDQADQEENKAIFLGCSRRDGNLKRKTILTSMSAALAEYGMCERRFSKYKDLTDGGDSELLRYHQIQATDDPRLNDVRSVQRWIEGKACIAREETAYLNYTHDLMRAVNLQDNCIGRLEPVLERIVISMYKLLGKVKFTNLFSMSNTIVSMYGLVIRFKTSQICSQARTRAAMTDYPVPQRPSMASSRDKDIYALPTSHLNRAARSLVAWLIVLLLLAPVAIISAIHSGGLRMLVVVIASAFFITVLSALTRAKTGEMFVAGATYVILSLSLSVTLTESVEIMMAF